MEVADVKSFANMLLDACETARKAGKPMLDTCFLNDGNKWKRQDMTRIAKDLSKRLHLDSFALPEVVEGQFTCFLPWLSPTLNELATWFKSLCDTTEKNHGDRIRDRFYNLLFCLIKELCDYYTCDGLQTFSNMISSSGNFDQEFVNEHLRIYIQNAIESNAHTVAASALQHCLGVCHQALSRPRLLPPNLNHDPRTDLSQASLGESTQSFAVRPLNDMSPDAIYPQKRRCVGEGVTSGSVDPIGVSMDKTASMLLLSRMNTPYRPSQHGFGNSFQPGYCHTSSNQSKAPFIMPDTRTCSYNSIQSSETALPMQDPDKNTLNSSQNSVHYPLMLHEATPKSTGGPFPLSFNDTSNALELLCSEPPLSLQNKSLTSEPCLYLNDTSTALEELDSETQQYLNDSSMDLQGLTSESLLYWNDTSMSLQGLAELPQIYLNDSSMAVQYVGPQAPYLDNASMGLRGAASEQFSWIDTSMSLQGLASETHLDRNPAHAATAEH
ncbi:hypothetical protein BDV11DRAFT_185422 [Aspergillus similis]